MNRFFSFAFTFVACTTASFGMATAEDVFMTIGGGPNPQSNQISLESNVHFFARTLTTFQTKPETVECYFADGKIAKRDLQYIDTQSEVSEACRWMATLFGDVDRYDMLYRDSSVPNLSGPARKARLQQRFLELADELGAGDRLLLYVTTHGGPAELRDRYSYDYEDDVASGGGDNKFNTTIALWNDEEVTADEFSKWLDAIDRDVEVILIMTQCYSGGFARAIFHDANPKHGISPARRCGFFSQRFDQPSTGCTPLADESTYRDYGTYFWEAIGGTSRTGEDVEDCDFDKDGQVSLSEAHCHALIVADSMDVPVRTSEVLLRKFSRLGESDLEESSAESKPGFLGSLFGVGGNAKKPAAELDKEEPILLTEQETVARCIELAFPEEVAVIMAIADELELSVDATVADVARKTRRLGKKFDQVETSAGQNWMLQSGYRGEIRDAVKRQYPEFEDENFHPLMMRILADQTQSKQFVDFIDQYTVTDAYVEAEAKSDKLETKMQRRENRYAKANRLNRMLRTVLLRTNLAELGTDKQIESVNQVTKMERSVLNPAE